MLLKSLIFVTCCIVFSQSATLPPPSTEESTKLNPKIQASILHNQTLYQRYEQQLNQNIMLILNALEQKLPELGPEGQKIIPHVQVLKQAVLQNVIDYSAVLSNIDVISKGSKMDQLMTILQLLSVKKNVRNSRVVFEGIEGAVDAASGVELKNYGIILSEVPKVIDVIIKLVQTVAGVVDGIEN